MNERAAVNIQTGQEWETRNGAVVRVTKDMAAAHRQEFGEEMPGKWAWALSNGELADSDGRVDYWGYDHASDLVRLRADSPCDAAVRAMDDTMGDAP